jgi:chromosome segregation ATPase
MRTTLSLAAAATIFFIPAAAHCQQQDQQSSAPAAQQDDSLGAAARRAREQKKEPAKPAKVFDNDNIPTQGGISAVGTAKPETGPVAGTALEVQASSDSTATGGKTAKGDEKSWRKKFTDLRNKVEQDKQELDILQRELGVLNVQYYNDPNKALQQDLTRQDINDKTAKIEAKKKQIEADQQAISDAEDELRRTGGDPGWAR